MNLHSLLKEVTDNQASDLYLIAGAVPAMTVDGVMRAPKACKGQRISPEQTQKFAAQIMTDWHRKRFEQRRELNMAYMASDIGRFRVNFLWQRGSVGIVVRRVVEDIPTLRSLGLPPVLREISLADRGIVIVSGATGSGKSTTMASMIDYRNHLRSGHIVTIEDPIEFVYQHRRSIVTQREIGVDTLTYEEALINSLRQAPSVISIGEMRDAESVKFALHASETGHLVFGTLHSTNSVLALERLVHFFPSGGHEQVLMQLALNLRAIVCQRLVPRKTEGRACATEILLNNPRVQDLIIKGELTGLRDNLKANLASDSSQSFDLVLYRLYHKGIITKETALRAAESYNEMEMKFRGLGITNQSVWEDFSDPWEHIEDDYDFPEHMRPESELQNLRETGEYSNENAQDGPGRASGISPIPTGTPEPEVQQPTRRSSQEQPRPPLPPQAKPGSAPSGAPRQKPASVAQRYRDLIEQATKDKRPLTDHDDLDLDELD